MVTAVKKDNIQHNKLTFHGKLIKEDRIKTKKII